MFELATATKAVAAFTSAVSELQGGYPRGTGETVAQPLYRIVRSVADDKTAVYSLAALPAKSFGPTAASELPARIKKLSVTGLDALFSFTERGDAWQYTDGQMWEQARLAAEQAGLIGNQARKLSESVALALLARRGCPDIKPWELP
jgi:hypothetical protein